MRVDKTTLQDLSIFHYEEEQSVFHHLNFTHTNGGREYLRSFLANPLDSIRDILDTQSVIRQLISVEEQWPATITNGTIMVIQKYFETAVEYYPTHPNAANSLSYKLLNGPDFSLTKYSVGHFIGFVKGMQQVTALLQQSQSKKMETWKTRIEMLLNKPALRSMEQEEDGNKLSPTQILFYANFVRHHFKQEIFELVDIYNKLDAYLSIAIACKKYHFCFPEIRESEHPFIETEGLFHLQLAAPVAYDMRLNREQNFLFLTGANMAGKSTFIKAVGVSIYLAHLGMGVPARSMKLSLFDGLLSNIQVADNVTKGESYFFNEVQRIKSTIEKISDGKKWLILIDELFKGTNVQDAMKCSTVVVEGLRKMQNALFILSTHLYEIGESLQQYNNIKFYYFETSVTDDQLVFSYQLKEGISNDRLGYLILRKEGVVEMLRKL
jgi:DNA mismatch repair ATPase MutS